MSARALQGRLRGRRTALGGVHAPARPRVATPAPRDAWLDSMAADPEALVTQGPAWTDALCAIAGARDASRLYDFGAGRRLVLPLVRRRGAREASLPDAWGFGGLVGGDPRPEEIRAVLDDLRRRRVLSIRIRPNPLQHAAWAAAAPPGVLALPRRAHVVDLSGGFDRVWQQQFSGRARTHVRRAERSGLEVRCDTTGELVGVFHALFMRSVERWAARAHEPPALARARARRRDPEAKFECLLAGLGDAARLWVAWADGRPAAAILVLQGANAHYTRGAIDEELAGRTRASYLLHRLAIEDACRAGCRRYHMGETGSSASLAQFKQAVGAEPVDYAAYAIERLPLTRVDRAARTAVKRLLRVDG